MVKQYTQCSLRVLTMLASATPWQFTMNEHFANDMGANTPTPPMQSLYDEMQAMLGLAWGCLTICWRKVKVMYNFHEADTARRWLILPLAHRKIDWRDHLPCREIGWYLPPPLLLVDFCWRQPHWKGDSESDGFFRRPLAPAGIDAEQPQLGRWYMVCLLRDSMESATMEIPAD